MNSQLTREFMRLLTAVRTGDFRDHSGHGLRVGRCFGFASGLFNAGIITIEQYFQLDNLTLNAALHAGKPLPSPLNAGPVMPALVLHERQFQAVKPSAQVPANERQVSAPAARPGLRLLCLLVQARNGKTRSLPVHTLRPMPPRLCAADTHAANGPRRWNLEASGLGVDSGTGLYLREAHATRPSREVVERCARHGQTNAFRPDSRTVRAGGVMA